MRRCKKIMGVVLVMVIMMGFAVPAYADGNTIEFGGTTITWNMTSSNIKITVANRTATTIQTEGEVYGFDNGSHEQKVAWVDCNASAEQSTSLAVSRKPKSGYTFKQCSKNKVTVYVSGNNITTFYP